MSDVFDKCIGDFPAATQKVHEKKMVYLDSAASSLKPKQVVKRISDYYLNESSNVHRGAHYLANKGTEHFEEARRSIANFISASSDREIVFTKGTTESLNLVADCLGRILEPNSLFLVTTLEHHANFVPWQMTANRHHHRFAVFDVNDDGSFDFDKLEEEFKRGVSVFSFSHASNTLGCITDAKKVCMLAKKYNVITIVDGAQYVANRKVDVSDIGCDFYAFSSHKMFGPFGFGVLYGKMEILNNLPPYQGGGSMIDHVSAEKTTYNEAPFKFEAGTPHVAGAIGTHAAIKYIDDLGHKEIDNHESEVVEYCLKELKKIDDLVVYGPEAGEDRVPLVSFNINGVHASDVGTLLDQMGIAVRTGHHCTQPLMARLGVTGTVRASFSIYNSKNDVDALIGGLKKCLELLK
jgi:cysteine desulfurase/selenocysteine lyase